MTMSLSTNNYLSTVLNNDNTKLRHFHDRRSTTMLYLTTRSGGLPMKGGPSKTNDNDDEDQRKGGN